MVELDLACVLAIAMLAKSGLWVGEPAAEKGDPDEEKCLRLPVSCFDTDGLWTISA